jgi:3-oxoadipate enol-lactonase
MSTVDSTVARLAEAVLSVRPLVEALPAPVRVAPVVDTSPAWHDWTALVDHVARRARVVGLTTAHTSPVADLHVFERVISQRLALGHGPCPVPPGRLGSVNRIVDEVVAAGFDTFATKETISSFDGVPLNVYAAGQGAEAVVIVPACGMPAVLAETWIRYLARERLVLTWESRGLFDAGGVRGDHRVDLAAQAADLFAVLDHHGVPSAHVVGLCGGAMIALVAAAERPAAVTSLSLWHGAYGFAEDYPKTRHQHGLIELMVDAARSKAAAEVMHTAFCQVMLTNTPTDVAHLVLYPYATAELLYRYCRLNTGITGADIEPYLPRVNQPTLVVTSEDDRTAHPAGSARVARGLPNGQLRVEPHGDHISLFAARDGLLRVAADFMARHPARTA